MEDNQSYTDDSRKRWQDLPISTRALNVLRRLVYERATLADVKAYWQNLSIKDRRCIVGAGTRTMAELDSALLE